MYYPWQTHLIQLQPNDVCFPKTLSALVIPGYETTDPASELAKCIATVIASGMASQRGLNKTVADQYHIGFAADAWNGNGLKDQSQKTEVQPC